jgi:hypothetical protein
LLLNGSELLGNRIVEIRSNANTGNETLLQGVFNPGRQHPTSGAAEYKQRQINGQITEDRSKADKGQVRENQIKGDQRTRAEEPGLLRDTTSEGQSTL